jgi:hypothetical protein
MKRKTGAPFPLTKGMVMKNNFTAFCCTEGSSVKDEQSLEIETFQFKISINSNSCNVKGFVDEFFAACEESLCLFVTYYTHEMQLITLCLGERILKLHVSTRQRSS